jgi:hypothetical protein
MRKLNTVLSLSPAPLFVAGAVYSLFNPSLCGASYEMTVMWVIMALAHTAPWFLFYQQHFTRD